jgi:hypothetical protein
MSAPTPGSAPQRQTPAKRPFVLPLAAGLIMLTIVREALPHLAVDLSPWVAFIVALALGYAAYAGTEWLLLRRDRNRQRAQQGQRDEQVRREEPPRPSGPDA